MLRIFVKTILLYSLCQNAWGGKHDYEKLDGFEDIDYFSYNQDAERSAYIHAIANTLSYLQVLRRLEDVNIEKIEDGIWYGSPSYSVHKIWKNLKEKSFEIDSSYPSKLYKILVNFAKTELNKPDKSTEDLKELCRRLRYQQVNIEKFKLKDTTLKMSAVLWKQSMKVEAIQALSKKSSSCEIL